MMQTEDFTDSNKGRKGMPFPSATLVIFLLGVTGFSAAALWRIRHRPPQEVMKSETIGLQQAPNNQDVTFLEKMGGKGMTRDGALFSFELYKSSDGVEVSVTRENRKSPTNASKALQRRLKKVIKIIERESKLNEDGQRTGERVVAMFALTGSDKEQAAVLWTDGSQFYYIESASLRHALEFEKKFYR